MAIASHKAHLTATVAGTARGSRLGRLFAFLLALILLLLIVPSAAVADIYKWTDENGRTVLSNVPPMEPVKAKNLKLVMKDSNQAGSAAAAASSNHVATPTEQALLRRIETLERELQAQRYAAQSAPVSPPAGYGGNYPPPPAYAGNYAPPPPAVYYSSAYPAYYPNYYPAYYPSYYRVVPSYSYIVYPPRTVFTRPVSGFSHGPAFRGGGGHRGRR